MITVELLKTCTICRQLHESSAQPVCTHPNASKLLADYIVVAVQSGYRCTDCIGLQAVGNSDAVALFRNCYLE